MAEKLNQISWKQEHIGRPLVMDLSRGIFPTRIVDPDLHLKEAARQMEKEHRDVLFVTVHLAKDDELREYPISRRYPPFRDRRIIVPNASDQQTSTAVTLAAAAGIDLYPVMTADAYKRLYEKNQERMKHNQYPLPIAPVGRGNRQYFNAVSEAVSQSEDEAIVWLAPHAARVQSLNAPIGKAAEYLFTLSEFDAKDTKRTIRNPFTVVFLGIQVPGVTDYKSVNKLTLFRRHTVHVGAVLRGEEIRDMQLPAFREEELAAGRLSRDEIPSEKRRERRPYWLADRWIVSKQFPPLVDALYQQKAA